MLTLRPIAGIDHVPPAGPLDSTNWIFDPLDPGAYDVIVADPPWEFAHWSKKGETAKSAGGNYALMGMDAIRALPVGQLANPAGALLLMWTTAPLLPEQMEILRGWGFRYNSRLVWRKVTASGKVRMSTGYRVRCCDEIVLVGIRGKVARPSRTIRSVFDGAVRNKRGDEKSNHSRKPAEFWGHVIGIHPTARRWCELFSRERHVLADGIEVEPWGDQVGWYGGEAAA